MKTPNAMKRAITILTCMLSAGAALAQNPQIIQNTKAVMQGVQANQDITFITDDNHRNPGNRTAA